MKHKLFWVTPMVSALGMLVLLLLGLCPVEKVVAHDLPAIPTNEPAFITTPEDNPFIGWQMDEVTRSRLVYDISLKVDAAGHIHMVYGGSYLYYAYYDGGNWQYQVVDTSNDSLGVFDASLAVDANHHPRISYFADGQIRYAVWTGTQWLIETVATIDREVTRTSLALDSLGNPHMAFGMGTEVVYAHRAGSTWVMETADSDPLLAYLHSISLALDPAGNPGLIYEYFANIVHYSYRNGGTWQSQEITTSGFHPSLAYDSSGIPHISYVFNVNTQQFILRYATWNGTGWNEQALVTEEDDFLHDSFLVLDATGSPHITYVESDRSYNWSRLHYVHRSGASWNNESLGVDPNYLSSLMLGLDAAGNPHVGYREEILDDYFHKVKYTYKSAAGWVNLDVDQDRLLGSASALALDSNQQPHTAYIWDSKLNYSRWTGAQWEPQVISPSSIVAIEIALKLDPWDRPHIVFGQDGFNLQYVAWDGNQWISETVPITNSRHFSLALDPQGSPHLCSGNRYTHKDAGVWHTQTLTGYSCVVAVDSAGRPHIASYGGWGVGLQYIHWDGANWLTESVDSTANYDALAIQIGPDDLPQIAYTVDVETPIGYVYNHLKYARWDGTNWQFSLVSEDYDDDSSISMALSSEGEPSLLFQRYSGARFFARFIGDGWLTDRVEPDYGWPTSNSLAVDAGNRPHVLGNICGGSYNSETCFGSRLIHWVGIGVDFSATPRDGYIPLEVSFTNTSLGNFTSYAWDFGDGATSTAEDPVHVYAMPGVYTPTLTVSGPDGTYTLGKPGYIHATVLTDFKADFRHGYTPFEVAFTNLSHGDFTSVLWDFGDSITSTLPAPTHTYTTQGLYTVTLTVSGPSGSYQRVKPGYITALETVETLLEPGQTAALSYTTLAGTVTTLEFPTDAVTQTTNLLYRPLFSVTYPITSELGYAGQAFELEASVDGVLLEHLVFGSPVTTTIEYQERVYEETIALHTWDGRAWQEAACGDYERNPEENWLSLPICHIGRFALVAKPVRIYFPLIGTSQTNR